MSRLNFLFLVLFIIGNHVSGNSQTDNYVDSLEKRLTTSISDTTRAKIYSELAESIIDEKEWMRYNQMALEFAKKKLLNATGDSRSCYLTIKASSLGNKGYYYDDHGNKIRAIDLYFQSLEIYDLAHDEQGKASVLGNLGIIYSDQGDHEDALDYFQKALKIKLIYEPNNVAKNYINIGVEVEAKGDTALAYSYYQKAFRSAQKMDNSYDLSTACNNLGSWYFNRKKYPQAIPYLKQAITYGNMAQDDAGVAWAMASLGSCFLRLDKIDSAYFYLLEAEAIALDYGYPELTQSISEKLYQLYSNDEKWELALNYYHIANQMEDSIQNVDAQKASLRQKLEYDYSLDAEQTRLENIEKGKRQKQQFYFIVGGLVLVLIFAIVLFSRLKVAKRQKRVIEEQQLETELQKEIIELKNEEIVDSITYAKRLQEAIFPERESIGSSFSDAFLLYLPKDIIAGDFYWMHEQNESIYICAADCTGHGVPGAMVSFVCANALDQAVNDANHNDSTGTILDQVTRLVVDRFKHSNTEVKDGMDIALCKINLTTNEVEFSGANNPCLIKTQGSEINIIKGDRQPIGKYEMAKPFTTHSFKCSSGDWIYLFSDGFSDQFGGPRGKKFQSAAMRRLLDTNSILSGEEQQIVLEKTFLEWKGEVDQIDDVCVIGVKI